MEQNRAMTGNGDEALAELGLDAVGICIDAVEVGLVIETKRVVCAEDDVLGAAKPQTVKDCMSFVWRPLGRIWGRIFESGL